jgi:hypothetical protein
MNRIKRVISILLIFLIHSPFVLAESNSHENSWQLWAKPRICVMPSNVLMCKMETDFNWIGVEQADICLLSSQQNAILQCWTHTDKGQLLQQIKSDKLITYWLSRSNEDKILVKTVVRVVTIPQRSIRRRRRHIWSLL